jgi:hypothetical protein
MSEWKQKRQTFEEILQRAHAAGKSFDLERIRAIKVGAAAPYRPAKWVDVDSSGRILREVNSKDRQPGLLPVRYDDLPAFYERAPGRIRARADEEGWAELYEAHEVVLSVSQTTFYLGDQVEIMVLRNPFEFVRISINGETHAVPPGEILELTSDKVGLFVVALNDDRVWARNYRYTVSCIEPEEET